MKYFILVLVIAMLSCANESDNDPLITPQPVEIDSSAITPKDSIIIPDSTASGVSF